jgi:hypothetical protein
VGIWRKKENKRRRRCEPVPGGRRVREFRVSMG